VGDGKYGSSWKKSLREKKSSGMETLDKQERKEWTVSGEPVPSTPGSYRGIIGGCRNQGKGGYYFQEGYLSRAERGKVSVRKDNVWPGLQSSLNN